MQKSVHFKNDHLCAHHLVNHLPIGKKKIIKILQNN